MDSKKRQDNFSNEETKMILQFVELNKEALFSSFNNTITVKTKQKLWQEIAAKVTARNLGPARSVEKVKKKWADLKHRSIAFSRAVKNPPTGGGGPLDVPWWVRHVLDILGQDSCIVEGIQGGGESDDTPDQFQIAFADASGESADQRTTPPARISIVNTSGESADQRTTPPARITIVNRSGESADLDKSTLPATITTVVNDEDENHDSISSQSSAGKVMTFQPAAPTKMSAKRKRPATGISSDSFVDLTAEETKKFKVETDKMKLEMEKMKLEMDLIKYQTELTRVKITNNRIKQVHLFYDLRKTERELGLPLSVIDLDIAVCQETDS